MSTHFEAAVDSHTHDEHGHQQSFVERWFFSTNHKDIGTLYLIFSFVMFIIGAAMSVVIRAELAQPGLQFVKPEFFNQMTTLHALVMIFGGVMPAFVGLANWIKAFTQQRDRLGFRVFWPSWVMCSVPLPGLDRYAPTRPPHVL